MPDIRVPVLIVGGGGAGLSTSIFLSSYGVEHLLVERHESTSNLPKAHYLNQRTMEIFHQHDVADVVYEAGTPIEHAQWLTWQTTLGGDGPLDAKVLYKMDCFGGGDLNRIYSKDSACPPSNLPQLRLEPILRAEAERRAPGTIRFSHELLTMGQDADGVTATIQDNRSGQEFNVVADYLVAADGGKTVGGMVGVEMVGERSLFNMVSTHITADFSRWWPEGALMAQFVNPDAGVFPESGVLVQMGPTWGTHSEEWVFHFAMLADDPTQLDGDQILPTMRTLLNVGDIPIKVHKVGYWLVEGVLADKYREGRVFLVGDAAHRHPPTTGLGLNTGIQDVHNLAWKLAAVLHGQADAALLDTYQSERHPIGHQNVEWAMYTMENRFIADAGLGKLPIPVAPERQRSVFQQFMADNTIGAARRARFEEAVQTQRTEFQAHGVEIGYFYSTGALVPDDSAPPACDPMGTQYCPTTRPGHRLPHAWIHKGLQKLSTHDLAGPTGQLVLITGPDGGAWATAAAKAADKFGIPITVADIGGEYTDNDGQWAEVREINDGGAILVRPDNHIAWRALTTVDNPDEKVMKAVAQTIGR